MIVYRYRCIMDDLYLQLLPNILSFEECKHLIKLSEEHGYVPAVINQADGTQILDRSHRDSQRVILDDAAFAAKLFDKLSPHLPAMYHGKSLVRINERMRFLKYSAGQHFGPHSDGCFMTLDGRQTSLLTLILYLNHVQKGGETIFYKDEDLDNAYMKIDCKRGQVLLFDHDWYHEGAIVSEGLKYCIRTDVMFES